MNDVGKCEVIIRHFDANIYENLGGSILFIFFRPRWIRKRVRANNKVIVN